jgi:hypothetical protein
MKSIGFTYDFTQRLVAVTTIPELLKSKSLELCDIFFIKLDIEGAEYRALVGALSLLESEQRPDVIQFEFGISARAFNTLFIDFVQLFQALNYDLFVLGQSFLMNLPNPILIDNIYEYGNFVAISSSAPKELSMELTHNVKQLFQS